MIVNMSTETDLLYDYETCLLYNYETCLLFISKPSMGCSARVQIHTQVSETTLSSKIFIKNNQVMIKHSFVINRGIHERDSCGNSCMPISQSNPLDSNNKNK